MSLILNGMGGVLVRLGRPRPLRSVADVYEGTNHNQDTQPVDNKRVSTYPGLPFRPET